MRRAFALPVATVGLFLVTGVGAYAYESPTVTDGHLLYPVKQGCEHVEAAMQLSGEAQANFHARMMERRLAEAEVLWRIQRMQQANLQIVADEMENSLDALSENQEEANQPLLEQLQLQQARFNALRARAAFVQNANKEMLRNAFQQLRVQTTSSAN